MTLIQRSQLYTVGFRQHVRGFPLRYHRRHCSECTGDLLLGQATPAPPRAEQTTPLSDLNTDNVMGDAAIQIDNGRKLPVHGCSALMTRFG